MGVLYDYPNFISPSAIYARDYTQHVQIRKMHSRYRKQMKCGYSKLLYNQRNEDEAIVSVIKRLFGDHLMSRLTRTQNRELSLRCILQNA